MPAQDISKGKICKIVAYGCQTPSAQRRSDQFITKGGQGSLAQRQARVKLKTKILPGVKQYVVAQGQCLTLKFMQWKSLTLNLGIGKV